MTTEEMLQWADEIVFAKTEKHLDSVQTAILEGAWQGLKYEDIAKKCHRSKSHIKNIAAELWQTLSELLGEEIHKANVHSILERKAISIIYNYGKSSQIVKSKISNHINICAESRQDEENPKHRSPSQSSSSHSHSIENPSPIIDLIDAPEIREFYNRTTELNTLKQWILEDHIHLITIYGFSGIGKSILTRKLIEQINSEFNYIFWKSLTETTTLSSLKNQLQQFFTQSQQSPLPTIIDYFRNSRCLVILDDLQNLFQSGELAGQYLTEHKDYAQFWQQIAKNYHQSCVILLSWEKPREIATLQAEKHYTRTLHLKGLESDAEEILREYGLTDEEKWRELINLYQGHPIWLNIIASTIVELFDSSVSLFLAEQEEIFIGDLKPILESHLERLSKLEQQVISWLSSQNQGLDISQVPKIREFSKSEFTEAIQSLIRRGLIEKISEGGRSRFLLNPIWQQLNSS